MHSTEQTLWYCCIDANISTFNFNFCNLHLKVCPNLLSTNIGFYFQYNALHQSNQTTGGYCNTSINVSSMFTSNVISVSVFGIIINVIVDNRIQCHPFITFYPQNYLYQKRNEMMTKNSTNFEKRKLIDTSMVSFFSFQSGANVSINVNFFSTRRTLQILHTKNQKTTSRGVSSTFKNNNLLPIFWLFSDFFDF